MSQSLQKAIFQNSSYQDYCNIILECVVKILIIAAVVPYTKDKHLQKMLTKQSKNPKNSCYFNTTPRQLIIESDVNQIQVTKIEFLKT